jgi:hypothetical protein
MATRSSNWDLSAGMDVDYSGNKEIAESNKRFQTAQTIIDKAYNLDREGETQQSNIDYTNAKNKAYLDTIGATTELTNAKNRESLYDLSAQNDIEKALALGDGFAQETTPAGKEIIGYEPVVDKGGNPIADSLLTESDKQNRTPIYKETPASTVQRPRTQLERLQEAQKHITNPRARLKLQDEVRKEVVNQAYQLHAFEPDKALEMLRNNGIGTAVKLNKNPDGSYVQMLEGGRTINYNALDAAALVGDVIKGSNDYHKMIVARQAEAQKVANDNAKSKRDFEEKLVLQRDTAKSQSERDRLNNEANLKRDGFNNASSMARTKYSNDSAYSRAQLGYEDSGSSTESPSAQEIFLGKVKVKDGVKTNGMKEQVVSYLGVLGDRVPNVVLTSGKRDIPMGTAGEASQHLTGGAADIRPTPEIKAYFESAKGKQDLAEHGLKIHDETTPEALKKTGGIGAHYHIEVDTESKVYQSKAASNGSNDDKSNLQNMSPEKLKETEDRLRKTLSEDITPQKMEEMKRAEILINAEKQRRAESSKPVAGAANAQAAPAMPQQTAPVSASNAPAKPVDSSQAETTSSYINGLSISEIRSMQDDLDAVVKKTGETAQTKKLKAELSTAAVSKNLSGAGSAVADVVSQAPRGFGMMYDFVADVYKESAKRGESYDAKQRQAELNLLKELKNLQQARKK